MRTQSALYLLFYTSSNFIGDVNYYWGLEIDSLNGIYRSEVSRGPDKGHEFIDRWNFPNENQSIQDIRLERGDGNVQVQEEDIELRGPTDRAEQHVQDVHLEEPHSTQQGDTGSD